MQLLLGLAIGIAFGFILQRSSVAQCSCIRGTLALQDFHMLKLLITAVAVGMLIVFPLSTLGIVNFSVKTTYVVGVALGGLLFGAGMAIAGFCPGTVLAALPQGGKNVLWALFGGLAGAFAYSLVYGTVKPFVVAPLNLGKLTLPQLLGTDPVVTGIVLGALILGGVILFDRGSARKRTVSAIPDLADGEQVACR